MRTLWTYRNNVLVLLLLSAFLLTFPVRAEAYISTDYPNLSNPAYSTLNPFYQSGYGGQCTAFAWGRAKEKVGISLPFRGHAVTWWNGAANAGFQRGSSPRANSLAIWSYGTYGHVAYVERVDGSNVIFNEANWSTYKATNWGGGYDGSPKTLTATGMLKRGNYTLLGYIYLGGTVPPPPTPRYNPVAPGDAGFTRFGTPSYWWNVNGGLYGTGIYTYCNGNARNNGARWTFDLSKLGGSGTYKVEAYIPSTNATTRSAHYHINTSGGLQYRSVNQYNVSNAWVDLGTYSFAAGSTWVELDDATGETYVSSSSPKVGFDAIRLTRVTVAAPAKLEVVGSVTFSRAAPYTYGETLSTTFTVKNTGGQRGTWDGAVLGGRGPSGEVRDFGTLAPFSLDPGQSKTFTYTRTLDFTGDWSGWIVVRTGGTNWATIGPKPAVTFTVGKAAAKAGLSAPSVPVAYKAAFKLGGTLKDSAGAALARRKVRIQRSYDGTTWTTIADLTTSSTGGVAFETSSSRTARYRLAFGGDGTHKASTSAVRTVAVKVSLSVPTAPTSVAVNRAFTSSGYLKPKHAAGTYPVEIRCYRYEKKADGTYGYVYKKKVSAKASDYSTYTKYSASVSLPTKGKWRIRTFHGADSKNAETLSGYRYLTVQ